MKTMIGIFGVRYAQKFYKMEFKIFQNWYRNHPRPWKAKGILNHFEKDFASFLTVRRPPLCNVYEDESYKDKHGKGIFMKF